MSLDAWLETGFPMLCVFGAVFIVGVGYGVGLGVTWLPRMTKWATKTIERHVETECDETCVDYGRSLS